MGEERHRRIGAEFIALGMDFYSSITSFRSILCTRLHCVGSTPLFEATQGGHVLMYSGHRVHNIGDIFLIS